MAEAKGQQATADAIATPSVNIQYGGEDRFVLELEFVQMLANPHYLSHLATQKLLDNEEFIAYLDYLQYFRQPKYLRYLQYPTPTLRALELLQEESFRKAILIPGVVEQMNTEGFQAALAMS
ncbi:Mediator of RNA polymerase II transcription subunit 31 [Fulvia fulva]|uniref:Mediator of RNA polymerase II transcription subunit 31 n=1 Tax=Passalora fulva TaxID=5499 RepID=A0A9Q8P432_PASFU|nr:Mediator of RNA polymerase II transcription subunit 31 [Fulvia fulva]KAK4634972.1 Mediator of RNA polymerase II transcription subunit 31 [Fulvia fulva]KAK4637661.1 Mediator of RNA polymerase II transcription subunit 31 [Fulvia fulva]UJO12553.1 Mediator of RNA polymerase II transcription subunit 31 [Fulvia fulva]WPV10348.1 Mediator of RNA polymerase II transcription subunit 31 [Fulvia fulva]WPV23175.1 Mediator of RNA polymerase II transcription subunit 31 [Fulvia fulva]